MPRMKSVGPRQRNRTARKSRNDATKKRRRGESLGRAALSRVERVFIPSSQLPSLLPGATEPQLIENRPHPDFFFPVTGEEVLERIAELPREHTEGLTHVWLRHRRPGQVRDCFGSYDTGPGFRAIVLNPWPRRMQWDLGATLYKGWKKWALQYNAALKRRRGRWVATFTPEESRRFYLDDLILHEVGHHVDWRRRSPANRKQLEDFANQYAVKWARWLNREKPRPRRSSGMSREAWLHLSALVRAAHPGWTIQTGAAERPPHPSLTVSFRLVDRRGRDQTTTLWIRPAAIVDLTADGLELRIRRAQQRRQSKKTWRER